MARTQLAVNKPTTAKVPASAMKSTSASGKIPDMIPDPPRARSLMRTKIMR